MKALVAFGTRYGSTAAVAEEIAVVLRGHGLETEVADLRNEWAGDIDGFDLVVLGSGIIAGSWSKKAQAFLSNHSTALAHKPVAMFVCCGDVLLAPERLAGSRVRYLEDVAAAHGLQRVGSMALFGGVLDFDSYGFLVKALLKKLGAKRALEEQVPVPIDLMTSVTGMTSGLGPPL